MQRPSRPKKYQMPTAIRIIPCVEFGKKPHWKVFFNDESRFVSCQDKVAVRRLVGDAIQRATMNDDDLYMQLLRDHGCVLVNEFDYYLHRDGSIQSRSDKHEWHDADEVAMLQYLDNVRHPFKAVA